MTYKHPLQSQTAYAWGLSTKSVAKMFKWVRINVSEDKRGQALSAMLRKAYKEEYGYRK